MCQTINLGDRPIAYQKIMGSCNLESTWSEKEDSIYIFLERNKCADMDLNCYWEAVTKEQLLFLWFEFEFCINLSLCPKTYSCYLFLIALYVCRRHLHYLIKPLYSKNSKGHLIKAKYNRFRQNVAVLFGNCWYLNIFFNLLFYFRRRPSWRRQRNAFLQIQTKW